MQQSSIIFAYLLVAYLLFITLKGELPAYITLLRGGGQQVTGSSGNSGGLGSAIDSLTGDSNALLNNQLPSLTDTQASQIISLFGSE